MIDNIQNTTLRIKTNRQVYTLGPSIKSREELIQDFYVNDRL